MISSRKIIALLSAATLQRVQALKDDGQLDPLFAVYTMIGMIGAGILGFTVTKCILHILDRRHRANAGTIPAQQEAKIAVPELQSQEPLPQESKLSALDGKQQIQGQNNPVPYNPASFSSVSLENHSLFIKPEQSALPAAIDERGSIEPVRLPSQDNIVVTFH